MDVSTLFEVRGRNAFVSGASLGIGAMIAEGLLRAGARVWICSRKEASILEACDRLSAWGECHAVAADLSTDEGIDRIAQALGDEPLDILVNNAGASWAAPIGEMPRDGFQKVLNLNVTAPFLVTQKLMPNIRKAARVGGPARVINIASIDGIRVPDLDTFSYSASKSGVIMLTRHMAKMLAKDNITVNAIAPGVFESQMTAFWFDENHPAHAPLPRNPMNRPGSPEDIVGAILYLSSRASSYVTGTTIAVSGGEGLID